MLMKPKLAQPMIEIQEYFSQILLSYYIIDLVVILYNRLIAMEKHTNLFHIPIFQFIKLSVQ